MPNNQYVAYFGYGSLVNRATHQTAIVDAFPAQLKGWKRCWKPRADTSVFDVAILSVRPEPETVTEGLLVVDHLQNLPVIDERERNYRRVELNRDDFDTPIDVPDDCPIFVYEVPDTPGLTFGTQRVLRSYLDAVLQGFLNEFGEQSVGRFVQETDAFDIGILNDDADPSYQRHVSLSDAERRLFDAVLAHLPSVPG